MIIGSGEMIDHVIDRPFTRAKTRNRRGGVVQFESGFGVHKQVAAGTPIEPQANFRTKPRPDGDESHRQSGLVPASYQHMP
jgi:hypothetical protein